MKRDTQYLQLVQLDEQLRPWMRLPTKSLPKPGWVQTIRKALGMTTKQLGARIGMAQPNVTKLEKAEQRGAVTLATLRRAAEGLDCDLVYAFVPRNGSLEETVRRRARAVAERELGRVSHSMVLESQGVAEKYQKIQRGQLVDQLLRQPWRHLWR